MTGIGTTIASALVTTLVAAGGVAGGFASGSPASGSGSSDGRTALVIDASLGRDGRALVDPRLRALDAELRLPRTAAEARTDLRYFAAQGYRLVVAGPDSREAARETRLHAVTLRR
jgi:hypothetical protein